MATGKYDYNTESDSTGLAIVVFSVVFLVAMMCAAAYRSYQHNEMLRREGCQLLTEAPTGRKVYCGKACYRPEVVRVYECANNVTKTEVY